jgi:hypothetical protein
MKSKIIDPSVDRRWDIFVSGHENASIYHSSEWKEVLELTYHHLTPLYVILENNEWEIEAGVASFLVNSYITGKRIVGLPFSSYSDPLFSIPEHGRILLQVFVKKAQELQLKYAEFRLSKPVNFLDPCEFQSTNKFITHILWLNRNKDDLFASFHTTSVRQNIKRAEKNGLNLVEGKSRKDIKEFFRLHLLTRRKIGLPSQPERFFTNMFEILYPKGMLSLLMADYSDRIVAATIVLKFKNTVYSEYTAADPQFLHIRPNHWIFWKAIERALDEGYEFFDFGKSSKSNKGLVDFKRRWGGTAKSLYYIYHPQKSELTSSAEGNVPYRIMTSFIKHLPLWFTKSAGRVLYNHLGG